MKPNKKLDNLKNIIREMGSAVVAFSGGVDSTFLLRMAGEVLGKKTIAVIGRSDMYPDREYKKATDIAKLFGVDYVVIETDELNDKNYCSNPPDRCYYCKKELMSRLLKIAEDKDYKYIIEGSNTDDVKDFRPGRRALDEMKIRSPLIEAGFSKQEIREISKKLNLPTWDKPSMPCLSSRFPYGMEITKQRLKMVEKAEDLLIDLGIKQVRVRYHGDLARIEVSKNDMSYILKDDVSDKIIKRFREIGFNYISLDLQGYRMGSLNEILKDR